MSPTLDGIHVGLQAVIGSNGWVRDNKVVPLPWRNDVVLETHHSNKKLKFAVMRSDGILRPHPPIASALERTATRLRALGHQGRLRGFRRFNRPLMHVLFKSPVIEWPDYDYHPLRSVAVSCVQ